MTVLEMVLKIAARVSDSGVIPVGTGLDSVNDSLQYLSLRLSDRNSDLVGADLSQAATAQTIALPATFNGFSGRPKAGDVYLDIAPGDLSSLPVTGVQPYYYNVFGSTMYLYPTPESSILITGRYWVFPVALAMTDSIPYSGRFDALILDMATKVSMGGYSAIAQMAAEVELAIDIVLFPRKPALPAYRPKCNF